MPRTRKRKLAIAGVVVTLLAFAWLGAGWIGARLVTRTSQARLNVPPSLNGVPFETVRLEASDGVPISASFARSSVAAAPPRAVVIVTGIRGNRCACVERAADWSSAGWSVLLPDLRGTGESGGDRV